MADPSAVPAALGGVDAPFAGAKVALIHGDRLVTYLRDDIPTIPYPGRWDLPGGGREGGETSEACVLRETYEEFGLHLATDRLIWKRRYVSATDPGDAAYFFVAPVSADEIAGVRFGDEGQYWQMMGFAEFLGHPQAVPALQARFAAYLAEAHGASA